MRMTPPDWMMQDAELQLPGFDIQEQDTAIGG